VYNNFVSDKKAMTAETVVSIYKMLEENDIKIVIDGGWGVDALLGRESRPHSDLDIAVEHKDVPKLRELLHTRGYKNLVREDTSDYNFVLGDEKGHEIDVHSYAFDDKGHNIYGIAYPINSLKGKGIINNQHVRCIAPEYVIIFHDNYEPGEKEFKDIKALCEKFGLQPPPSYKKLLK